MLETQERLNYVLTAWTGASLDIETREEKSEGDGGGRPTTTPADMGLMG